MILISVLILLLVLLLYKKITKPYSYWIERGVKQRKQVYLLGDSAGIMLKKESLFDSLMNIYKAFPKDRYCGMYETTYPILIIRDLDLIKRLTVKDFDHFVDHREFMPKGVDPIWSKNLFALKGNQWRYMRSTLSPCFTSSKMRFIFTSITECAKNYINYFKKTNETVTIELKDIFTRYTNDVIATVAFGIECDSINEKENEFYLMGRKASNFSFWKGMLMFLFSIIPPLGKVFPLTFFPKSVIKFFTNIVMDTIKIREEQGIIRPDMIHLLLEARKGKKKFEEEKPVSDAGFAVVEEAHKEGIKLEKFEITDTDIIAQALLFFVGGFESVATLMSFMGYELTVNPEVQERLQQEIDETMKECNGELSYEDLTKMKYMDMVISETLRKWPTNIGTDRMCTTAYTITPETPDEKPVQLKPGDAIWFPINGIHHDPKYWPNPEKFDPERFNEENKHKIQPYSYLPFGMGPRNCIGSRLALLEVKTILCYILHNYDLVVTEKTDIPLKLSKTAMTLMAENGMWVGLKPRVK